jgi:predicted GNAT superfamily acetyltransferase
MAELAGVQLNDLRTLEECQELVRLQKAIWGEDGETVPATTLMVSAKRGGILIGAQIGSRTVGVLWSLPGLRHGIRTHWSHLLGVLPEFRGQGIAERLKAAQRNRAMAQDVDLVEWSFDPLLAPAAHLNLHVLGGVGANYGADMYGTLPGEMCGGTPTDRLLVEWHLRAANVKRRLALRDSKEPVVARSNEILNAPVLIQAKTDGDWVRFAGSSPIPDQRHAIVPIPPHFLEMQQLDTAKALEWRLGLREVMTTAFTHDFRVVDFFLDRETGGGSYLLSK